MLCEAYALLRADDEIRTRDPNLGKVVLYQLSHIRVPCFQDLATLTEFIDLRKLLSLVANHAMTNEDLPLSKHSHRAEPNQHQQFHRYW